MNKIAALIPARGGSKSIPLKNIKEFCGQPLLYWTAKAACESSLISEVFIATDCDLIKNVAEGFQFNKLRVIPRSQETATDYASTESLMVEFASHHLCDTLILVQATSPLLTSEDLDGGIAKFLSGDYDSLLAAVRQRRFLWNETNGIATPLNYHPLQRPMRQEWKGFFVENGAFYITRRTSLLESGCRISGTTGLYEMPTYTYHELDEPEDWSIMENIRNLSRSMNNVDFNRIRLLITDVDGVLTDGGMYYSHTGEEMKKFNTVDGMGLAMLRESGIKVMFLTRETTPIVTARADKLHIDFVATGIKDKVEYLDEFFNQHKEYGYHQIAYIGDDLNDVKALRLAYFSAVPCDANKQAKEVSLYVCKKGGGKGCVREVCELILANKISVME